MCCNRILHHKDSDVPLEQIVERGKPASYGQEILKRRKRITDALVDIRGLAILDFGCGNGAQTLEFAGSAARITACDISADDLAILEGASREKNIKNIFPVHYDGTTLPLPNESVDLAISFAVLEHVTNEKVALSEIRRVLKKNGEFIISVPNKWWVFETHGARLPYLPWNRVPFFSWLPSGIHRRFAMARIYKRSDITGLLLTEGFVIQTVVQMMAPMDVVPWPSVQEFLRKSLFRGNTTTIPALATEIFVHCRKPA